MKETKQKDAIKILTRKIGKYKGLFSLSDASTATGLAIDEAKTALDQMMSKYICRLQLTENGDLIYNFGSSLKLRGSKSFKEIMEDIGNFLWKAFMIFFKIWITVTLVVYFVLFLIILIALILANSSSRSENRKSIKLDWVFRAFIAIFEWNTYNNMINYSIDRDGYRYRSYESKKAIFDFKSQGKKSLIASVYDFVFGPPRVNIDPLTNEKEVAAYLREQKGILTISELIALAGWTFDEAEKCMTDYIVRFKGSTDISENNVMYGRFDQIIRAKNEFMGGKIEYYWNEYEPPYLVTGNTSGKNFLIFIMNGFNLCMGLYMLFSENIKKIIMQYGISPELIMIGLGIIPVVFSIIFFLVPILRIPFVMTKENKRKLANKRKRLIKIIFDFVESSPAAENKIYIDQVNNAIMKSGEKLLSEPEIKHLMDRIRIELRGEKDIDISSNRLFYSFNRINDDYKEAKRIRSTIKIDTNLGNVIMDV